MVSVFLPSLSLCLSLPHNNHRQIGTDFICAWGCLGCVRKNNVDYNFKKQYSSSEHEGKKRWLEVESRILES